MAKLLLDQNLSFRLTEPLQRPFPGTSHVRLEGLDHSSDRDIWNFAEQRSFAILSKDSDFHHLSLLYGPPPKVIWIRRGNSSTTEMLHLLTTRTNDIEAFLAEPDGALLVLQNSGL